MKRATAVTAPAAAATTPAVPRVLHVVEHWRPVNDGYTTRGEALVTAQSHNGTAVPRVLVSSRQPLYGEAALPSLPGGTGTVEQVMPAPWEQRVRRLRSHYLDRGHLTRAIVGQCRGGDVDIIHSHWSSTLGRAALEAARQADRPLVAEVRFDLAGAVMTETVGRPLPVLERWLRRRFEGHLCGAAQVVAASHTLGELLLTHFPQLTGRLTVVPNGVDIDHFRPRQRDRQLATELGLGDGLVIGTTSNMLRYEGLDLLLQALAQVSTRLPGVQVLFIGAGTQQTPLQQLAQSLGVATVFTGRVLPDEIPRYLGLLDIFAVPRRSATITCYASPVKLLEAMSCGLPVVASGVGDITALLGQDRGVVVAPESVTELAQALADLGTDAPRRQTLGRQARNWMERYFSWNDIAALYSEVYRSALEGGPRP